MGLSLREVAEIYSPVDGTVGSGYFCSPRLVLTAKHVIVGALPKGSLQEVTRESKVEAFENYPRDGRAACRVRPLATGGRGDFLDAVPVWWAESADVALLAVTSENFQRDEAGIITWADVSGSEAIDVTAVGFPEADTENGIRESRQLSGKLNPLSGIKAGRFVIHVSGSIGNFPDGTVSSWAGVSGAALFADDFFIGVVLVDADVRNPERLELWALPARAFATDPGFLHWLRWDGGEAGWAHSRETPSSNMGLLRKIMEANRQLPVLGEEVVARISAALNSRSLEADNRDSRRAVSVVLSMLRSKNVLYAELENEIWEYVFKSLRELRKAIEEMYAAIVISQSRGVSALLEVMLTAVRDYLGRHETPYIRYMAQNTRESVARWERNWPGLERAALGLISLREVLVAAVAPLNAFAQQDERLSWKSDSHVQEYFLQQASPSETEISSGPLGPHRGDTSEGRPLSGVISALRSEFLSIRVAAVDELAARGGSQCVAALIGFIDSEVPSYPQDVVADRCWNALSKLCIGPEHLPLLMRLAVKSGAGLHLLVPFAADPEVMRLFVNRIEGGLARDVLSNLGDTFTKHGAVVIPELTKLLYSDNENTRRIAARLICKTDDLSGLPAVFEHLNRVDGQERSNLRTALWEFSNQRAVFESAMNNESYVIRTIAVGTLSFDDSSAVMDLLERAAIDPHEDVRRALITRIGGERSKLRVSPRFVALLNESLTDSSSNVRLAGARAWFDTFFPKDLLKLVPLLDDCDSRVRATVAELLGSSPDPGSAQALVTRAHDHDSSVRAKVIESLVKLAKREGVSSDVFIGALDDSSWVVRCNAIDGIAELSDRTAVSAVCAKLHDENELVRRRAVNALSRIRDSAAIPCLANALGEADASTKNDIIQVLAKIGTDEGFSVLLEVAKRDPSEHGLVEALMYTRDRRALPVLEIIQAHAGGWCDQVESTIRELKQVNAPTQNSN